MNSLINNKKCTIKKNIFNKENKYKLHTSINYIKE